MKPLRFPILVLILVGVLTTIQALLGNSIATRLEAALGSLADDVLLRSWAVTNFFIMNNAIDMFHNARDKLNIPAVSRKVAA